MNRPEVELVCDGNSALGYGHVRRSLTLANALRSAGISVRLSAKSAEAQALFPDGPSAEGLARVIVFDVPCGCDALIREARGAGQRVVALDWFGAEEPDVAVVVHPHGPVRARLSVYVGWEFQMIRTELAAQPRGNVGEGVLVMLGGGDVLKQGHSAARLLAEQGIAVTLVQGPFADECARSGDYEVLVNPPDLAQRMADCGWMVTNAGGCMFEAMYLGKAVVALPQTKAEASLASVALERGGLLGVGLEHLCPYEVSRLRSVAARGAELIDGCGTDRVVAIVREQL